MAQAFISNSPQNPYLSAASRGLGAARTTLNRAPLPQLLGGGDAGYRIQDSDIFD